MKKKIIAAIVLIVALIALGAARAAATVPSGAPSTSSFTPYETTCVWHMAAGPAGQYNWPQTWVGCDIATPTTCGQDYQVDTYRISSPADLATLEGWEQSGLSYAGQDGSLLVSYLAPVDNAACPTQSSPPPSSSTPPPPPTSSVPASSTPPASSTAPVTSTSPAPSTSVSTSPVTSTSAKSSKSVGPPISISRTTAAAKVTRLSSTGSPTGELLALGLLLGLGGTGLAFAGRRRRTH